MANFQFIDLFAGIGGFRIAMESFGGECIFSSEIEKKAIEVYKNNHQDEVYGDITKQEVKDKITSFDVLCGGFPCQPFSVAGHKKGFEDTRGTLFFDICEIINKHNPKLLILENVSNLVTHDKGNTYKTITKHLDELGYYIPNEPLILSPENFGIPMIRKRIFFPAVRKDLAKNNPDMILNIKNYLNLKDEIDSIDNYIDLTLKNDLTEYELKILNMWNKFYQGIDMKIIGFPVIVEDFKYQGDFSHLSEWKQKYIQKNINLYQRNKKFIDEWLEEYDNLEWIPNKAHKKFEWHAGDKYSSIFECLIQFRQSGIRAKKPDKFSTLVAINQQQIIGKLKRKLTPDEAKGLLCYPESFKLHPDDNIALKHLGNSVNIKVVKEIFNVLQNFLKN